MHKFSQTLNILPPTQKETRRETKRLYHNYEVSRKVWNLITLTFYPTSHTCIRGKCLLLNGMKVQLQRVPYFLFTATVSTHKNILASVHISIHVIYHYNSQGFRPKAKQISRLFWLVFEIDKWATPVPPPDCSP